LELTDIAADLFEYIVSFRQKVAKAAVPDINTVRYELESIFQNMESKLASHPHLAKEYRQAKYPLVALADEIILTSAWSEAKSWEQFLLEKKYFSSNIAGNHFFELLQKVEHMSRGVVAIYFYCLAFGFRGGFELNDPSISRLEERLLSRILDQPVARDQQIFEAAYHVDQGEERKLPKLWKWSTVLIIAVAFLVALAIVERGIVWPMLMGWQDYDEEPAPAGEQPIRPAAKPIAPTVYTVQLGVFGSQTLALHFAEQMNGRGLETQTIRRRDASNKETFLVTTGSFQNKQAAVEEQQRAEALTPLVTQMRVVEKSKLVGDCIAGCP